MLDGPDGGVKGVHLLVGYLVLLMSVTLLGVSVKWWNCDWKAVLWTLVIVNVYTFWWFNLSL